MIPFVGLQQSTYDVVKAKAMDKNGFGMRPSAVLFLSCGAVAAMVAQSVVYPLDVIRRRVQMKTFKPAIDSSPRGVGIELSTWLKLQRLIRFNGGIRGLYAGIVPSFLKCVPAVSVSVLCRDVVLGKLEVS